MKIIHIAFLLALLLLSGCNSIETHPSTEFLTQPEISNVLTKFKVHLARLGMKQVMWPGSDNPNHATFEFNDGSVPSLPSNEYIDLSYSADTGFILKITKAIKKSLELSDKDITDLKLYTEQIISESTSKNVHLHIFLEYPF